MPYISVRGTEHYYEWIRTPGSSQQKPIMVFIHGWAGSDRYWQSTANALSEQFDCLLYDMRGFGRSRGRATLPEASLSVADTELPPAQSEVIAELTYEIEEYAEDLAVLLDALQVERVYLNAHSMGASVATFFLNRYPARVERGILTCSGVFEYDEKAFTAFHKFGGYVVKFRPKWLSKIPFVDQMFMARFLYRSIPACRTPCFPGGFFGSGLRSSFRHHFYFCKQDGLAEVMPEEFAKLTVPTLIVAGEYDKIIPAEMGRQAAAVNDKVEFTVIPKTAHFPMLEDPATYLQRVREFLQLPALTKG